MQGFDYYIPTKILFGKNKIQGLGEEVRHYASSLLLVYGRGSIKRNGIYQAVIRLLDNAGITYQELSGVQPNPRVTSVRRGIELCREHKLGFILAVGGGSVIDCSKAIAAGVYYNGDPWDFFIKKAEITQAVPLGVVLTLAATGSEMNGFTVISNDQTKEKLPAGAACLRPQFSVLDPTYTFSVGAYQTAAGAVDIFVHILEQYFSHEEGAFLQDRLAEALLKTCIVYARKAIDEPHHYRARANLMWASSLALNGLLTYGKVGDWSTHYIEHSLSAVYDITHGVGLAIIAPHWMSYVLGPDTVGKMATYARNVWGIADDEPFAAARAGIDATRTFFNSLDMPSRLRDVGVDKSQCRTMAEKTTVFGEVGNFRSLTAIDIERILQSAY